MLLAIDDRYRSDALTFLQWLAYAKRPLALSELAETTTIDPSEDGSVDWKGMGGLEDPLEILTGLVVVFFPRFKSRLKNIRHIRLAHFSVKEYLESERLSKSEARHFHLSSGLGHKFLTESCLTYLMQYTAKTAKRPQKDLVPFIDYAAECWHYHALLKQGDNWLRETRYLSSGSENITRNMSYPRGYGSGRRRSPSSKSSLHIASRLGLAMVVKQLITQGVDINSHDGYYFTPLQAAASENQHEILELLLDNGADVNIQGGRFKSALHAAVERADYRSVELLLDRGAEINALVGKGALDEVTALHLAACRCDKEIIRLLLERGADVNIRAGNRILLEFAAGCDDDTVKMLLDHGAEVIAKNNPLTKFAWEGSEVAVTMLLKAGADVNREGGSQGSTPLMEAAHRQHEAVVKLLLDYGADVNVQTKSPYPNALAAAIDGWNSSLKKERDGLSGRIIVILLDHGADVSGKGALGANSALEQAVYDGFEKAVEILLDHGADVHLPTGEFSISNNYRTILEVAERWEHHNIAKMLIAKGAKRHSPSNEKRDDSISSQE